jgi:hypothetical protein
MIAAPVVQAPHDLTITLPYQRTNVETP